MEKQVCFKYKKKKKHEYNVLQNIIYLTLPISRLIIMHKNISKCNNNDSFTNITTILCRLFINKTNKTKRV